VLGPHGTVLRLHGTHDTVTCGAALCLGHMALCLGYMLLCLGTRVAALWLGYMALCLGPATPRHAKHVLGFLVRVLALPNQGSSNPFITRWQQRTLLEGQTQPFAMLLDGMLPLCTHRGT